MNTRRRVADASWLLVATVVAGGVAYLVQLLAPSLLRNDATFVAFLIVWSAIYLGVSALSGVQQEFARATHKARADAATPRLARTSFTVFAAIGAVCAIAAVAMAFIVAARSVPVSPASLIGPFALALLGYLAIAMLSGMLSGLQNWPVVAAITMIDATLRAVVLVIGFMQGWHPVALAYAIAVPFGLVALGALALLGGKLNRTAVLDASAPRLISNAATNIGGAAAMGSVISGLPLLIGVTMPNAPTAWLGGVLFAITLTRAPIVTPAIALQSYIISTVRGESEVGAGRPTRKLALLTIVIVVVCALAAVVGPPLVQWLTAGQFTVSPALMVAIVASAFLTAALSVTAALLIARGRHGLSALGWIATAVLTVVLLVLPPDWEWRMALALVVPALIGLAVHALALSASRSTAPR